MNEHFIKLGDGKKADVCFLLEGTYPFVHGGVSSWVHQLINNMPEYQFAIVFIGSAAADYSGLLYELPANVCHLEAHYIADFSISDENSEPIRGQVEVVRLLREIQACYLDEARQPYEALADLNHLLALGAEQLEKEFNASHRLWHFFAENYSQYFEHENFSHYFWSLRAMYRPLVGLLRIAESVPEADCFHSVSTGYAGTLGAFLRVLYDKPHLLTEHGIYTKERRIEIYSAPRAPAEQSALPSGLNERIGIQRRMWIIFFEELGRLTYSTASIILTLYQANQHKQIELGAPAKRCRVIPNGIQLNRFKRLRSKRPARVPKVIALIGRVVRIKDIKTFIRTIDVLVDQLPGIQGWIVGPEDEDPEYVAECKALVRQLGLQDSVQFLGFQRIDDVLPKVGVLILTSISEGQPLVLLEGFAAGVPAAVTDVGSCRELIEGRNAQDIAFGKAGAVVPIANPQAMANAVGQMLSDDDHWHACQQAAIRRVETVYDERRLIKNYQNLYQKAVSYGRHRV